MKRSARRGSDQLEAPTKIVRRVLRARYVLTRVFESPPGFLIVKARIELRKRLYRRRVLSAAAAKRRFSDGYERDIAQKSCRAAMLRADVVAAVRELGFDDHAVVESLARDFDAGRWQCLGYGHYVLSGGRWSIDDFHSHEWPHAYFADIDFVVRDKRCDVKVPWEKSRMHWLTAAALACCFDHDPTTRERRQRVAMNLFDDWVRENPFGVGVNWVSAMEVSIRAINIIVSFALLGGTIGPPERARLLSSAGEHLHYLRRFPEASDVPGNHYLATMLGLYVLKIPMIEEDSTRQATLARSFVRVCAEQFSGDGLHIEFCPIYHRLSLDMVAIGYAMMRRACPAVATALNPLLERGTGVCKSLCNAAGELPLLGDSDSGKVLDFGQDARRFGAYAWLLAGGTEGTEVRLKADAEPPSGKRCSEQCFPESVERARTPSVQRNTGRLLSRGEAVWWRCPRISSWKARDRKSSCGAGDWDWRGGGHDHDDALSFWYSVGEQDVMVDVGCPPYTRDLRERFRAIRSSSHNVVTGAEGERFDGSFGSVGLSMRGGPEGRATVEQDDTGCRARCELVPARSIGRRAEPGAHVRTFHVDPTGNVQVVDRVSLSSKGAFNVYFHLHPRFKETDIEIDGARALVSWDQRRLMFVWTGGLATTVVREEYLFHPEYGSAVPANRLVVTAKAPQEVELRTEITLMGDGAIAK